MNFSQQDQSLRTHLPNFLQEDSDSLSASACLCHFSEGVPWISVGSWDKPLPGMLPARCPQLHPEVEKDIQGSYRLQA